MDTSSKGPNLGSQMLENTSKNLKIIPVILAGGTGTRLWPLSRESYPKQLLTLTCGYSLLQQTILRIANYPDLTNFIIICNEQHAALIQSQIDELKLNLDYQLILEPVGRNTAPAVAVAANYILQHEPTANMLVLAADHHMEDEQRFMELIKQATHYAQQKHLITFGVHPTKPETGYGYIQVGQEITEDCYTITKFVEKPDYKTAQKYTESRKYYWNSGIFLFSASAYLAELKMHREDIYDAVHQATKEFIVYGHFVRFDKELFAKCPSESIDYAVMEKSTCGLMIKLDVVWSDLGTWSSIYEIMSKDEQQNSTVGDVILYDCYGCYVYAQSRLVAAVGLSDQVIIETNDAVLVIPRARAQQVKDILQKLKKHPLKVE
jgi:mannose-1-phosphate guanylyltransferase